MRSKSTFVALFFVVTGLLSAYVFHRVFGSLFSVLNISNESLIGSSDRFTLSTVCGTLAAGALAVVLYTTGRTRTLVVECFEELYKVNWPAWTETKVNTLVVIVTSVVAAAILGVFDITFGWLSSHNLFLY